MCLVNRMILGLLLTLISTVALAKSDCGIVLDVPPGSTLESYARIMQKNNPELKIEFRPGGMSANAINLLNSERTYFLLTTPSMFGENNPVKNPPIELIRIPVIPSFYALTNSKKEITWDKALSEKINIGFSHFGSVGHTIGLQLQQHNPKIVLVPVGGELKGLPLLLNGDLDIFILSSGTAIPWINSYKFNTLFRLQFNKKFVHNNVSLISLGFVGVFIHKSSTIEEKSRIVECLDKGLTPFESFSNSVKNLNAEAVNLSGEEINKALDAYIAMMKKYGLQSISC